MINIVCVLRKGGKVGYDASWVEKLHNNIKRNLTREYTFTCLSDCEVPCNRIALTTDGSGWWAKMQLFREFTSGPTLFFDLDTIIFNNIDELVEILLEQNEFVMWKDETINISSSAIMYWNGDYSYIYNEYIKDPSYYETTYSLESQGPDKQVGDQAVISKLQPHIFINDLIPNDWIRLISKQDHNVDFSNSKILIFKKVKGKPSVMTEHKIVKEHWK